MNMKNAMKTIGKAIADNRSNIVTALVATGVISTTIRAIKDTPKVNLMIDEAVAEKGEDLTKKEKAVIYAKGYWKTIAIGTGTLVLLVGNRVLDQKSMTGLVGAYVAAEGKIQSIKESIKETVDEETQKKIADKTTEKEIEKNPYKKTYDEGEEEFMPPSTECKGLDLFWDDFTGHWFWSTRERIEAACNMCNKQLLKNDEVGLDDFYEYLGIDTSLLSGMFGWHIDQGFYNDKNIVEAELDSEWGDYTDPSRGKQYGILRFVTEPVYEYGRYNR